MSCAGAISWLFIPGLIAGVYFDVDVSAVNLPGREARCFSVAKASLLSSFWLREIIDGISCGCVCAASISIPVFGPLYICFHWNGDGET